MTADQSDRIHRLVTEADSDEANFLYVIREVLHAERAAGWQEGYAEAAHDQYEAERLKANRARLGPAQDDEQGGVAGDRDSDIAAP